MDKQIEREKIMKLAERMAENRGGPPEKYILLARRMLENKKQGIIERKPIKLDNCTQDEPLCVL